MNQGRLTSGPADFVLSGWLPTALLLIVTAAVGPALGSLSRPLFVVGCAAAGWLAWRRSTAGHIQSAILLFAFAPFVRRVVDVSVGYDASSIMLIGPLLFILMPLPSLWTLLSSREQLRDPWLIAPA